MDVKETLNGESENNSRKLRDLMNRAQCHPKKGQHTLSQETLMKGDVVGDTDDDDEVRTKVSQKRVTATHCTD